MPARLASVLGALALFSLAPTSSQAQTLYAVAAPQSAVAPARTGWTPITFTASSAAADSGGAVVSLPFAFPFYGTSYSSVTVTVDGLMLFDNDANAINTSAPAGLKGCGWAHSPQCANTGAGRLLGDRTTTPHNFIAFWWTDMIFTGASGFAEWTSSGTVGDQTFSLRYTDWRTWAESSNASPRTVTVELHEGSGQIDIYYGAITNTGDPNAWGATVGIEGPLSANDLDGLAGLPCSNRALNTAGATTPFRCRNSDWPAGQRITFATTTLPDLRLDGITMTNLHATTVAGVATIEATLLVQITNRGVSAASPVDFDVFLSSDRVTALQTWSSGAGFSLPDPAQPTEKTVTRTLTVQFPRSVGSGTGPSGSTKLYFGGRVDPTGQITEPNKANNLFTPAANDYFQVGVDLMAEALTLSPTIVEASFGQYIHVEARVRNVGTDDADPFNAEIWLSASASAINTGGNSPAAKLADLPFPSGLVSGSTFSTSLEVSTKSLTFTPNAGLYYLVLRVDASTAHPAGDLRELNEANNLAATSGIQFGYADLFCSQPDFKVTSALPPYEEVSRIYFGTDVRLAFKAGNRGKSAVDFFNGVTLTTGTNIKPDYNICTDVSCSLTLDCVSQGTEALSHLTWPNMPATPFAVVCSIPATKPDGSPMEETGLSKQWRIGILVDGWSRYDEGGNDGPSSNECSKVIEARRPAMDLVADRIEIPSKVAPGEVMAIVHTVHNAGIVGDDFQYWYVLTGNEVVSTMDAVLPVIEGASKGAGHSHLEHGAAEVRIDYVEVPPETSPGTYFVGLLLDPDNRVTELDEKNNALCSVGTVEVLPPAVQIANERLADAMVGAPYEENLVARGCVGPAAWDLYSGALSEGLALESDGRLHGTPTEAGELDLVFRARCDGQVAIARLPLRVIDATTVLTVETTSLAPAVMGAPYEARLVAVGGVKPYAWTVAWKGTLPSGLVLDTDGTIHGTPTALVPNGLLGVAVTDAHGTVVQAAVRIRVVAAGLLRIVGVKVGDRVRPELPNGQAGQDYRAVSFVAEHFVGNVGWDIAAGELPEGIRLDADQLYGEPIVSGAFQLTVRARDESGATDEAIFTLVIMPRAARIEPTTLPATTQGDAYLVELGAIADKGSKFALRSGALPQGLTLSSGGRIAGTVATNARVGAHDFVVLVTTPDGAMANVPLTIRVGALAKQTPAPAQGCSSGGAGTLALGVLFALMAPLGIRRRAIAARA